MGKRCMKRAEQRSGCRQQIWEEERRRLQRRNRVAARSTPNQSHTLCCYIDTEYFYFINWCGCEAGRLLMKPARQRYFQQQQDGIASEAHLALSPPLLREGTGLYPKSLADAPGLAAAAPLGGRAIPSVITVRGQRRRSLFPPGDRLCDKVHGKRREPTRSA